MSSSKFLKHYETEEGLGKKKLDEDSRYHVFCFCKHCKFSQVINLASDHSECVLEKGLYGLLVQNIAFVLYKCVRLKKEEEKMPTFAL